MAGLTPAEPRAAPPPTPPPATLEDFEPEAAARPLAGAAGRLARLGSLGLACYALAWVVAVVEPMTYRASFLLVALALAFLLYPARRRGSTTTPAAASPAAPSRLDWALAALAVAALGWPLADRAAFPYRVAVPTAVDLVLGTAAILLVLEATRRTVGWMLPATALLFLLYAYLGPLLDLVGLGVVAHRGYYPDRLVGQLYMTLEGLFGVPLDVAATYIALFSVYGAVLEHSGAGQFYIDWALAALGRSERSAAAPGRAVTAAGFLLGTVSGSGVGTTVTLGSVAWPLLRRAGYPAEAAGAILSAAGIGAIMSPPTLGAAAFLIAEFLRIPYLRVLVMAAVPTLLYYLSAFLMIEADSRRLGTRPVPVRRPLGEITRRGGYHFLSPLVVVAMMAAGASAFRAVLWATALAWALSFARRETALTPRRLAGALAAGGRAVVPVAATTAAAGIIVGVVTLTGLGLKLAGIVVSLAGGSRVLTVVFAALAVWVLGLAVPVTASYIIAAVMVAPALTQVGVPAAAAHMFIFYYAVLSEVSPPTALSPYAAAAITGGNALRTMMLTWKYTLPAFLVPFVFTLSPEGMGVLLQAPLGDVLRSSATAALGVAALAMGFGGWLRGPVSLPERLGAGAAGLLLCYASPVADVAGVVMLAAVVGAHLARSERKAGRG
ncbi:MAG TPA: TRAP transporter fused permease subunit [Gemmatimonadaceae bacterium]|nr:TRAP transporter fused permease subunit [Gemmatimonadaceae bacterium]